MVANDVPTGSTTGAPDQTARLAAALAHEINNPAAVIQHDLEQIAAAGGDAAGLATHALSALDRIVVLGRWLLRRAQEGTALPADALFDLTMYLRDERVAAAGTPAPATREGEGLWVLIIDDDPDVRAVMAELASAQGCEVTAVGAIADALTLIETLAPDLVLCDLMMPDGGADAWMKGCATIAPALLGRTFVITGGPGTAEAMAFVDAHADRVIYKPFVMADVFVAARRSGVIPPAR